jgi:hypothetical protein
LREDHAPIRSQSATTIQPEFIALEGRSVLNPRNFRSCGRATALFASFTLSLSFCVMKRVMLSITR